MDTITVAVIFGTRPEAIKVASVISELKKHPTKFTVKIIVTGQHREMLDQVLDVFEMEPDIDLKIMRPSQSLTEIASSALPKIDNAIKRIKPDLVLVQGDTSTTFLGSLVSFYHKIKVGHIEAGLRTGWKHAPFPEEVNRRLTSVVADIHFAPTEYARQALLKEGVSTEDIFVTGNTVIDALFSVIRRGNKLADSSVLKSIHWKQRNNGRLVLITVHRRESWGMPMKSICEAVRTVSARFPNCAFLLPVHPNPVVRETVFSSLSKLENVFITDSMDYVSFVNAMARCDLVLTDSGGIQEEAPALGKPVLIVREKTERPEAIIAGTSRIVGIRSHRIVEEMALLLENEEEYEKMAKAVNPYGDGRAANRIVSAIGYYFGKKSYRPKNFNANFRHKKSVL